MTDADFFSNVDFSAKNATMIIVFQPLGDSAYSLTDTTAQHATAGDRTHSHGTKIYSSSFTNTSPGMDCVIMISYMV